MPSKMPENESDCRHQALDSVLIQTYITASSVFTANVVVVDMAMPAIARFYYQTNQ